MILDLSPKLSIGPNKKDLKFIILNSSHNLDVTDPMDI